MPGIHWLWLRPKPTRQLLQARLRHAEREVDHLAFPDVHGPLQRPHHHLDLAAALRSELEREGCAPAHEANCEPEPTVEEILAKIRGLGRWSGPTGAEMLAAAVEKSASLQIIHLDNNQITDEGAKALASYPGDTSSVLVATKGGHVRPGDGSWTRHGT